jgi:hypothetical protein
VCVGLGGGVCARLWRGGRAPSLTSGGTTSFSRKVLLHGVSYLGS